MVVLSRFALAGSVSALLGVANAALQITSPGGPDLWWVQNSQNVLTWTCQDAPAQQYTILVANKDPKVLTAPIAIVSIANNFDCSRTITQDQANQAPGTGYTVLLADILNQTHVYATSKEFEIKPLGSAYPVTSTPGAPGSTSASSSGTATGGGAAASQTAKGAATGLTTSVGFVGAVIACILGVVTA